MPAITEAPMIPEIVCTPVNLDGGRIAHQIAVRPPLETRVVRTICDTVIRPQVEEVVAATDRGTETEQGVTTFRVESNNWSPYDLGGIAHGIGRLAFDGQTVSYQGLPDPEAAG